MWHKFRFLLPSRRRAEDRETSEELASLKEMANPGELGNLTLAAESARAEWGWTRLERLVQDLRYAARSLKSAPAFTLVAVLTLALGIGANASAFTAIEVFFLKKAPVNHPEELWQLSWSSRQRSFGGKSLMQPMYDAYFLNQGKTINQFSYPAYRSIRDKNASFSDVACLRNDMGATLASGSYFQMLGVPALIGRTFTPDDDRIGGPPVAVIGYGYWQSRFGGNPDVLGQVIAKPANGPNFLTPFTVIGVMPQSFYGIDPGVGSGIIAAMQPALRLTAGSLTDDRNWNTCTTVIARLRTGVAMERGRAEAEALIAQSIQANPPTEPYEPPRLTLTNLARGADTLRIGAQRPLLMLSVAVGAILLIACANLAGLLLARSSARRKEIATRLALGASRGRIVRQLLTESLLLSLLGAAFGLAIAFAVSPQIPRLFTRTYNLPNFPFKVEPDLTVAGFSVALAVLTALLFGSAPALNSTRIDLIPMMKSSIGAQGRVRFASGRAMLAIQVGLSTLLLIGAGLFLHTLFNLEAVSLGYIPRGLAYVTVQLPPGHPETVNSTLDQLAGVPGISSVTASVWPLFTSAPDTYLQVCVPGDTPLDFDDRFADSDSILPRFFETWGVPLLRGRDFTMADGPGSVIVNQAFVTRYLNGDPVGQAVHLGPNCAAETIVGVVGNSSDRPRIAPRPFVYRRWAQPPPQITYTVRTPGSYAAVMPALRRIVNDLNTRVYDPLTTGEQYRSDTMNQERLWASLLSGFGAVALFIACLGIYGMLAYLVARRTSEIGIRMALGARRPDVMTMVVRESLVPVGWGIAIGLAAAYPLTKIIASMLFGIARNDPGTICGASAALLIAAGIAAFFPARRASRVDPMRALRYE